jgi:hypothetical protein
MSIERLEKVENVLLALAQLALLVAAFVTH